MTIYEYGESIMKKIIGSPLKNKTFVCATDTYTSDTIDSMFVKMKDIVSNTVSVKHIDENKKLITDTSGNTYVLATEKLITKNNIEYRPTSLMRFMLTRTFTKDCLYVNENNEVIDIINGALKDITNYSLVPQINFEEEYKLNGNLAAEVMKSMIEDKFRPNNIIGNVLNYVIPYKPITDPTLLSDLFNQNGNEFLKIMHKYKSLTKYFTEYCDIKFGILFGNNQKEYVGPKINDSIRHTDDFEIRVDEMRLNDVIEAMDERVQQILRPDQVHAAPAENELGLIE